MVTSVQQRAWWSMLGVVFPITIATLQLVTATMDATGPGVQVNFEFTKSTYEADITENAVPKTNVLPREKMGMYLTDPTLDVTYKIIDGDRNKFFKARSRTVGDFCFMTIRTRTGVSSVINRERTDRYRLTVNASASYQNGPWFSAQTEVILYVSDSNDLNPLFYPTTYHRDLPEDTALHSSVLQVSASDADIGVNGEVYFSLVQKSETFAIHPTTGVVTLMRKLNFLEETEYRLDIKAEDRGPRLGLSSQVSTAPLTIRVIKVNAHAPTIELQVLPAVGEEGMVETIYAVLYVHDIEDASDLASVSIINGNDDGFFKLERGSIKTQYNIKVAKTLDREITPYGFNLTIEAVDKGSPAKKMTRLVHVQLQDTNDHAPQFTKKEYGASIEECLPVHTPVLFIQALDVDMRKNAEIRYSLVGGNKNRHFSIDDKSGLLSIAAPLDSESLDTYYLTVRAQDQGNPGTRKASERVVVVIVMDCNDNSPVFNVTQSVVTVQEGQPVGTSVLHVSAYDLDMEDNGYISYSIASMDQTPFTIETFSGLISTKEVLDYETMPRLYRLRVRASDWGSPFRRESEMVFNVKLKDINDNQPQFEKVDCMGYLSREAPIRTKLLVISAIDFDEGNIINYQIVSGNEDDCFELLSSSGVLRTNCDLQRHFRRTDFHTLKITATDDENDDDPNIAQPMTVNITLVNNRARQLANNDASFECRDTNIHKEYENYLRRQQNAGGSEPIGEDEPSHLMENRHSPVFSDAIPKRVSIPEGLPDGHKVLTMEAHDPDNGYNGRLTYVISSGNEGGTFKMDTYTGDLEVFSRVDRETREHYMLNVTVSDMGQPPRMAFTMLDIEILDVNDNRPKFDSIKYEYNFREDVAVNTTIMRLMTKDADLGQNADVTFSILSATDHFTLHPKTGILRLSQALDREMEDAYQLVVKAQDGGVDRSLSSTAVVTINVDDVNDNAPQFRPENYRVHVREDLPVGSVVMTITAYDPDLDTGGRVQYSFRGGDDGKFEVDRLMGTIRIAQELDFEDKQTYKINARARDHGIPSLSSRCVVIIEIIDVDENLYPPMFSDYVFEGRVPENEPIGTSVLQLVTWDNDKNKNAAASRKDFKVSFSIRAGSGLGRFTIDNNGVIETNMVLDRETTQRYWLEVYAQDQGTVPRSSAVNVMVEVQDINDNVPQTAQPVYYPSIPENSPEGTTVLKLDAYDEDAPTIGGLQISYDITSGNPQGFFTIDRSTGVITTTARKLDRENLAEHILEITITDNGQPLLSSTTRVVINVTDENDEEPVFTERTSLYSIHIPEMPASDSYVDLFRVTAHDLDEGANADIDYSIKAGKGNDRFHIHPKTGMISSQKEFVNGAQFDLAVRAVDNGRPQKRASARVLFNVVEQLTTSDHPPAFEVKGKEVKVMENEEVGHVCLATATDLDGDKIWYSITDGNTANTFSIGTESGDIWLARGLDWESVRDYNLTVTATDTVHTVSSWVHITVQDINDNRPEFSQQEYVVEIAENTAPASDILTVSATDADENGRLFYTIHSYTDKASNGKFKINSETGVITTKESLDREEIGTHSLTIMVRDQGAASKRSFARVIIKVKDVNDHAPEFLASRFEGRVFETAALGTSVLQVMAIDRDRGTNAEVKYSIISGNVGNVFGIDSVLGVLSVVKPVDRQTHSQYELVVKATDGGTPSLSEDVPVGISVTVADNAPPKFDYKEYTTEVQENSVVGAYVIAVHATSMSSVSYEITHGDDPGYFTVNPNSGVVVTRIVFDYESFTFANLTVRATNMVGAYADTTVLCHILDENDNKPMFTQELFSGNISEAAPAGSLILDQSSNPLVVKAADPDTDLNSLLIYRIVESTAEQVFQIDSSTGAIKTKVDLDHEAVQLYNFTVQVMDMGRPSNTAEVPAKVLIHVTDINDSPPVFTQEHYVAVLLLPTYTGVTVTTVSATDRDDPVNSQLTYSIIGGNINGNFQMDSETGVISVKEIEDLLETFYALTVQVSDGAHEEDATVEIQVDRTVESGLHFSDQQYNVEISENSTGKEQVVVVHAVGHSLNEHLSFSILNPLEMFEIGETSGVVQTQGTPFDREAQSSYSLVVEVRDQREPARVAHTIVHVAITDINDNVPLFVNLPYYASVSIDAARGKVIKQVQAIDHDIGVNGQVIYRLVDGGEGRLRVDSGSGEVSVRTRLSAQDEHKEYLLLLEAMDKGSPVLRAQVQMRVSVINKHTPVFGQPYYSISIPENTPTFTAVLSVEASSPTGKKLIYSVSNGDMYDEFGVDFNTGSLTVVEELDYDSPTRRSYDLAIRATDTQSGAHSETTVHVDLQDVNDNAPTFSSYLYVETVSEAVPIGTSILTVTATDGDEGENSQLRYHMEPMAGRFVDIDHFHITAETGTIVTKSKLDHEKEVDLQFHVVATDSGFPALSSNVLVKVVVTDLNDNPPEFDLLTYEVTITDLVQRGQFVTIVTASDPDSSDAGHLAYSIIGGNEKQAFAIDDHTGIMSLSSVRRPVLQSAYTLNVSVTDGVYTNFAQVNINVQSSNNHAPKFDHDVYDMDIAENMKAGRLVASVSAVDRDQGVYGQVTYAIESEDARDVFRIDADTGDLYTLESLDREETSVYTVPVVAKDGGGRAGYCVIRVNVADQGDQRPQFKQNDYKANIYVTAEVESSVLQVTAVDGDLGSNGAIKYSMYDGEGQPASQFFVIAQNTGIITVQASVAHLENQLLQFFVQVTDKGSPPKDSNVPVEVYIMSPQDQPPSFVHPTHPYFIREDVVVGTVITHLTSISNDTLLYNIVPGDLPRTNNPAKIGIDSEGTLTVLEALDRETLERFELTVKAETETVPPLVAYTYVTVQVTDVNDNNPQFETNPYVVNIAENAAVGSSVVQVISHDVDSGANAAITYSFAPADRRLSNVLAINAETGWITTLVKLDRETTQNYTFSVIATDHGSDVTLSDSTIVKITINDHNDCPPVFDEASYQGSVREDQLPGTIILRLSTSDDDLEENAKVMYHITEGDPLGQFNIRSTGELYVNKALDRETTAAYDLTVSATDGAFVTEVVVTVTVEDANDNSPTCEEHMYQEIVRENQALNSPFARVQARDRDERGTPNARINYFLEGDVDGVFDIHKTLGYISVRRPLDREQVSEYSLIMRAEDGGGLYCTSEVYITISDINDNAPEFTQDIYTVMVPENAEVNTLVTRVSATDFDLGINRRVRYAMRETDSYFSIDSDSGLISLKEHLDRESQAKFSLTVYASDQGTPKMTSTAHLVVHILDINDNPPQFEHSVYTAEVRESEPEDTVVMRVFATSRDTGVNAEITYGIIGGNEQNRFKIHSKLGTLSINNPLDYETAREYFLTVEARDGGSPSLSNTAILKINVTDANDNAPAFPQLVYRTQIREDIRTGANVIQVQAIDLDSSPDAAITYSLVRGDQEEQFQIGEHDGYITVRSAIDREMISNYALEIHAVDNGDPRMTGTTLVNIEVTDINDTPPRFTEQNYTAVIQVDDSGKPSSRHHTEDRDMGYGILQLYVEDDDLDPNGAPFKFDIVSGNNNNEFLIDRSGLLSTASVFDRQIKDTYKLMVRVFDNGTPPLHSDIEVEVQIIEESSFPPVVMPLDISVTALNDIFSGGVIGRVRAYDRDTYDTLMYEIVDDFDQLFGIHSSDGTIQAVQSLDAGSYKINVSVSDGKFMVYSQVRLQVIDISPEMAENAIVIRFDNMIPEEFLGTHRENFVNALCSILGVKPNDIDILSIQPASNKVIRPSRSKRNTESDLDVLIAVRKSPGSYYHSKPLRRRLANKLGQLEDALGVDIEQVVNDVCERDSCGQNGKCETEVHLMHDQVLTIITDKESYVSPLHALGYYCRCIPGFEGADCSVRGSVCSPSSNPCVSPKVCIAESSVRYHCECPVGLTGPSCEDQVEDCSQPQCRKEDTMTFTGKSYVRWRLTAPMERRLSLALDVKTIQDTAYLMYAVGRVDYSILEIDNGIIQYSFDCGSGPGVARVNGIPINNGNWHKISVERTNRHVKVMVDDKYSAEGEAPGTNEVLNLNANEVFFGAEVRLSADGYENIQQGYIGCMKDIKIDGVKLPLDGSSTVGVLQDYKDLEFHCGSYIPGVCSSNPCYNGGTCIPLDHGGFTCHCRSRFLGKQCDLDRNPCLAKPCLNGGQCTNLSNGKFRCTCPGVLGGPVCQKNLFCLPNPCKYGAVCEDGLHGPICQCKKGFAGDYCERNINECVGDNPCLNGGTCLDLVGTYNCTCPPDVSGRHCEVLNLVPITSSSMNITIEEIIGIAAAVAAILLIVIIFVIWMRCRHRRKRRGRRDCNGDGATDSGEFLYEDPKQGTKMELHKLHNNIPPSPNNPQRTTQPVTTRPVSYTPGGANTMNRLSGDMDTARNYGSAADDLEIDTIREPIVIPEFMRNVDAVKFSPRVGRSLPPPRSNDDLFHKQLNLENPNIVENYPEDLKTQNKLSKTMPMERVPMQRVQRSQAAAPVNKRQQPVGSNTSLPLSEADDDLAAGKAKGKASGYHWDTSDWNPQNTPLLAITEVPVGAVLDSPTNSIRSRDSNIHIDPNEYDATDCATDYVDEYDSEYVGDSEYAENESEVEDEDPNLGIMPESPNFQEILAMQGDLNYDDDPEIAPVDYNTHPNMYLPEYSISESGHSLNVLGNDDEEYNGNEDSADHFARDDEDDVIAYGFPRHNQLLAPNLRAISGIEGFEYDTGTMSVADDMSVSMGGYTSTNASCSDLSESNLCEIEDSEVNNSDDDDIDPSTPMISNSHMHTDV